MNNNGVNENLNSNNNIGTSTNNGVNSFSVEPEIIQSMPLSSAPVSGDNTNIVAVSSSSSAENVNNSNVNVSSPAIIETTYVGGANTLDNDDVVTTMTDNNIPNSIEIPIVVPEGVAPTNDATVDNQSNTTIPVTDSVPENITIPMPTNNNPVTGDIKVSALGQLKKKRKKEAAKAQAAADLDRGKINVKSLILPILIIIVLCGVISYLYLSNNKNLEELRYECSPINSSKNEVSVDVNSTVIQDLYGKVRTTIREDLAQPEWNDKMKIYLAYRQIVEDDKYDSNCNMFNTHKMEPYTCTISANFVPKAFTTNTLRHEWKMLFGEETEMPLINVKLENSCIGGYEYIPERDEYVQGYCSYQVASLFRVSKKLVEATAIRNTLILKEEVKYYENEKMHLPDYLKSGDYYYTFKLDMNYNYVLVSKTYNSRY